MKWALMMLVALGSNPFYCETKCSKIERQCRARCVKQHGVGSMAHLRCNDACAEDKQNCKEFCEQENCR